MLVLVIPDLTAVTGVAELAEAAEAAGISAPRERAVSREQSKANLPRAKDNKTG
jgi:hypothetical protein